MQSTEDLVLNILESLRITCELWGLGGGKECMKGIKISLRDLALAWPRGFFQEFEELVSIYLFPNI